MTYNLLIGKDISIDSTIVYSSFNKTGKEVNIIGDGKNLISCDKNFNFPEYSNIYIAAHGKPINDHDNRHILSLCNNYTITIEEGSFSEEMLDENQLTSSVLQAFVNPINIKLLSCYSGIAINNIDSLPVNSTLATFTRDDLIYEGIIALTILEMIGHLPYNDNTFIEFAQLLMYSTQVSKFSIKTNHGIKSFEASIFELDDYSNEEINLWRKNQLDKFLKFLFELRSKDILVLKIEEAIEALNSPLWRDNLNTQLHKDLLLADNTHFSSIGFEKQSLLIKSGVNVNFISNIGATALDTAVSRAKDPFSDKNEKSKSIEIIKLLMEAGADCDILDEFSRPMLHHVIKLRIPEIVEIFINKGADVNIADINGIYPMDVAISIGSFEILDLLFKARAKYADINLPNNVGMLPLHSLIYNSNDLNVFKFFIEKLGANVNAADQDGNTVIHRLANSYIQKMSYYKDTENLDEESSKWFDNNLINVLIKFETLVNLGANLSFINKEGQTPFDIIKNDIHTHSIVKIDNPVVNELIHNLSNFILKYNNNMNNYVDYANQNIIENDDKCYELEEFFGYSAEVMDICGLTLESSLV